MSKLIKIGVAVALLLVILVVALVLILPSRLSPELVRSRLLPLVEEKLQRTVTFDDIDISLFSGLRISDVRISQRHSDDPFVEVAQLQLDYRFWPLLSGRVEIDQVRLEKPHIQLIRQRDGQLNIADLTASSSEPSAAAKSEPVAPAEDGMALKLLVSQVSVSDGQLTFIDRFADATTPYRYQLEQLNFKAEKISLEESFPYELSARLGEASLAVSGHYQVNNGSGDALLSLKQLNLAQFSPYYRDLSPVQFGRAQLATEIKVELADNRLQSSGQLSLSELDPVLTAQPELDFKPVNLTSDYQLNYDLSAARLQLDKLDLALNGFSATAKGVVDLALKSPVIDATLKLNEVDLRAFQEQLPESLIAEYRQLSLAGSLSAETVLQGSLDDAVGVVQSALFRLADVQASAGSLRGGISGEIDYAAGKLSAEKLRLNYADSEMLLSFSSANPFARRPQLLFDLSAELIDLNRLLGDGQAANNSAPGKSAASVKKAGAQSGTVAEELGPFDLPLDAKGTLTVKTVAYKKLNLSNLSAQLQLQNNRFKLSELTSVVTGGGRLQGQVEVDLTRPGLVYQGQLSLEQPDLVALVNGFWPEAQGSVSGRLHWQSNFSGKGTQPQKALQQLQLNGDYRLSEGQFADIPVLNALALFLSEEQLKKLAYEQLAGDYKLQGGKLTLKNDLDSSRVKLATSGSLGLDGSLDVALDTRLAPALLAKLGNKGGVAAQLLSDENGWGQVPLKLKGTLSDPQLAFDSTLLKKQAQKKVQEKVTEKVKEKVTEKVLDKLIPGGSKDSQAGDAAAPLRDNALKKLFGN